MHARRAVAEHHLLDSNNLKALIGDGVNEFSSLNLQGMDRQCGRGQTAESGQQTTRRLQQRSVWSHT